MRLGPRRFDFDRELAVMAIVNRTPDSFFDGGSTFALDDAVAAAEAHVAAGADIVDVGGVKAGPGTPVSVEEEHERVVRFVERFRRRSDAVVSVDTFRPAVARAALAAGANLVNDVTGLSDPGVADVVAAHPDAGLVLTHHGGARRSRPHRPVYDPDVTTAVRRGCADLVDLAVSRGVDRRQLLVDPGHDMAKTTAQSLEVTRRLDELVALGLPVLVALSNKDFVGEALDLGLERRGTASLAAAVWCVCRGARVVRTHDPRATAEALRMIEVIMGWRRPARELRGLH